MSIIFYLPFVIVLYLLPTIIAYYRGVKRVGDLFVLNIILGWTVIVWAVCLLIALSD